MDSEIEEADSAPSQLNFERPLELCDLYLELQKMRKRNLEMEDRRSQSQFNHFHSQRSALNDLSAICKPWCVLVSEIEEADSASQLNFERPLELCNFMYWELQKLGNRNLEMEDLRSQSQTQSNHFLSQREAMTNFLAKSKKLYWYVSDSEIEEADLVQSYPPI